MANRIVLGELPGGGHGLRVSKPGSNVLSTGLQGRNVAFDSRWFGSSQLVTMGSVKVPQTGSTTVNFGVTLPTPPTVLAMLSLTGGQYRPAGLENGLIFSDVWDDPGDVNPLLDYTQQDGLLRIYTNRFVVYPYYNSSAATLRYIVLRP